MPAGWIYVAGFGIKQMVSTAGMVAASVGVGQDTLDEETGLTAYIEKQMKLIGTSLKDVQFAGPKPVPFQGAEEAQLLFIRHETEKAGSMVHAQTYVRAGRWLGIVTLTATEAQLKPVRADYDAFLNGLRIGPPATD